MLDKSKTYSNQKNLIRIINLLLTPLILITFIILRIPDGLKNILFIFSQNIHINLILFTSAFGVVFYLITFPLEYYDSFILEHTFSLSNQTLKAWLVRKLKKDIVAFIVALPMIFILYFSLRIVPVHWWLWTGVIWFMFSIILTKFAPIIMVPIFYKYTPIANDELRCKIIALAGKAGFNIKNVFQIDISKDTKKANAAVLGMGRQKRIVLCDTLLSNFSHEEIEAVMAHELGHHKLKHTLKIALSSGVTTFSSLYAANYLFLILHNVFEYNLLYDFESLVLIYFILSVFNIILLPLQNSLLRKLEKDADKFAIKLTGNTNAFISTMKKLSAQNLSDITPNKFYEIMLYSHPPISERISLAEKYKK